MSRRVGIAVLRGTLVAAGCAATMGSFAAAIGTASPVHQVPPGRPQPVAGTPMRYLPNPFAGAAGRYYRLIWGIDSLDVKRVESGEMIEFTWRVLDPDKAQLLNDVRAAPALVDRQAGVSLVVPSIDMVGMLRQRMTPQSGKTYWMAFANTGRVVKPGDRVDVVIGEFRANGLVVQ